jgi:pilus assembly protein FimV
MNQMMIALFQANPEAFSNNINELRQGAILRIPDENELRRQTPEMATAEVVRQTKAWQTGDEQFALLTLAHNSVMASSNELIH